MFYDYRQNNTFGVWSKSPDVEINVIIEADDPQDANRRASDVPGLYFDGCSDGTDCPCCGDRWNETWDQDEGDPVPSLYGTPLENLHDEKLIDDDVVIYFKDGTRQYASCG